MKTMLGRRGGSTSAAGEEGPPGEPPPQAVQAVAARNGIQGRARRLSMHSSLLPTAPMPPDQHSRVQGAVHRRTGTARGRATSPIGGENYGEGPCTNGWTGLNGVLPTDGGAVKAVGVESARPVPSAPGGRRGGRRRWRRSPCPSPRRRSPPRQRTPCAGPGGATHA